MRSKSLLVLLLSFFSLVGGASADCKGIVKITDIDADENTVGIKVRVYANGKKFARNVYYSIFIQYRGRLAAGQYSSLAPSSTSVTNSTSIESDEEYADDEIETFVTIPVVDNLKVKSVMVTGCYVQ